MSYILLKSTPTKKKKISLAVVSHGEYVAIKAQAVSLIIPLGRPAKYRAF